MYKVYKHTSPNGKVYIGITNQKPERRWGKRGQGYKENEYFYRAIQKHGWENFKHEILADGLTEEEAENMEIRLIAEYNSTDKSCGYNQHQGGIIHDTITKYDYLKGIFKTYDEIKKSPDLSRVFDKLITTALGFEYAEEKEISTYENGLLVKKETIRETKIRKPNHFAICFLMEHYADVEKVAAILPQLQALKNAIENEC